DLGPNSDSSYGMLAMALAAEGRLREAINALNGALRLNLRHQSPYWMLLGYLHAAAWWRRSETDPPAALKLTHPHSGGGCRTTPSGLPQEDAADGRGGDDPALGAGRRVDDPARGPRAAGVAQYDPAVLGRRRARPTQAGRPGPA